MKVSNNKRVKKKALTYYAMMLKKVKDELKGRTIGKNSKLRRYVEAYENEIGSIKGVSSFRNLIKEAMRSDIVLFGDFSTDKHPKTEFLRLVREVFSRGKKLRVALDWIPYRQRGLLADYIRGRLSRTIFLRRLKQKSLSCTPIPDVYFEIVDFLKSNRIPTLPIDFESVNEKNVYKKDDLTALRLASFYDVDPGTKLLVLAPDTWISKEHLPQSLSRRFREKKRRPKFLRVFSGSDKVFMKLARSLNEKATLVKSSGDVFVYNLIPPIARYNSFFNHLDGEEEIGGFHEKQAAFRDVLSAINSRFRLEIDVVGLKYKLFTDFELGFVEYILKSRFLSERQQIRVLSYVLKGESYFIPYAQVIYLSNLSKTHAAEEAGHYLRYIMAGIEKPKTAEDKFYATVVNEAIAYMTSKLLVPERKSVKDTMVKFAMQPELSEEDREVIMVHTLGYDLGEKLFKRFKSGKLKRKKIKEIFARRFTQRREAKSYYSMLLKMVGEKGSV